MSRARRLPDRQVGVHKAKQGAEGILGRGDRIGKGLGVEVRVFSPTQTQNLKWGVLRLQKVDGELEGCVRERAFIL